MHVKQTRAAEFRVQPTFTSLVHCPLEGVRCMSLPLRMQVSHGGSKYVRMRQKVRAWLCWELLPQKACR